ncbi:MAG: DUF1801 domain-containing protein [Bacteroidota bacterium]|nr:DUF1801 domain-containing protein [Bacteroidota bacterium]
MAENNTKETKASVDAYLKKIKDVKKRTDCASLIKLLNEVTGFAAKMWGTAIVGFGSYHYKYTSGREGDAPLAAFASRATSIVIYLYCDKEKKDGLIEKLGNYKMSGGCVHIKKLEDIDTSVLKKLVKNSVQYYKKLYPKK